MSAIITAAFTPPAAADVVTDTAAPDFARRFGGLERLYGVAGAARIRNAHVLVVGIGGVGSWAVEALARSGVGRLTMIDLDHVSESNINRQIHALDATVGQAKVEAMRDRIAQINPECKVQAIDDFVEPGTAAAHRAGVAVGGGLPRLPCLSDGQPGRMPVGLRA